MLLGLKLNASVLSWPQQFVLLSMDDGLQNQALSVLVLISLRLAKETGLSLSLQQVEVNPCTSWLLN